jgi:hypothetical protein
VLAVSQLILLSIVPIRYVVKVDTNFRYRVSRPLFPMRKERCSKDE